jgi:hypothetical protein
MLCQIIFNLHIISAIAIARTPMNEHVQLSKPETNLEQSTLIETILDSITDPTP